NQAQNRNPYVTELVTQCRQGLALLRQPVKSRSPKGFARRRPPKLLSKPLLAEGRLQRLRFEMSWKTEAPGTPDTSERGRLILGPRGPLFSSAKMACGYSQAG